MERRERKKERENEEAEDPTATANANPSTSPFLFSFFFKPIKTAPGARASRRDSPGPPGHRRGEWRKLERKNKTGTRFFHRRRLPLSPLSRSLSLSFHPQLISGKAEIFGAELQLGERREVAGGCPFAVFSWQGATVALSAAPPAGSVVVEAGGGSGGSGAGGLFASGPSPPLETAVSMTYVASHTPMPSYLNAHDALEARRALAAEAAASSASSAAVDPCCPRRKGQRGGSAATEGPRAIVVGPTNAGKSTICKILLNYAVRGGWRPTFLDLDVGQGALAPPGCLAATPVDAPLAADAAAPDAPLAFFFGSASPADNLELFRFMVAKMAALLNRRSEAASEAAARQLQQQQAGGSATQETRNPSPSKNNNVAASGWVVNWPGWCDGEDALSLLCAVVEALSIDTVLVVGNERLHAVLQERLGGKKVGGGGKSGGRNDGDGEEEEEDIRRISVANLPRSEGAVVRDADTRRASRSAKVKEYFYGPASARPGSAQQLRPAALRLRPGELELFRAGGAGSGGRPRAPATALPIGHEGASAVAGSGANGVDAASAAAAGGSGGNGSAALRLEKREAGPDLVHSLLALSHSKSPEGALSEPVAGFLYVTAVEAHSGVVTVLAPCGGSLPGRVALAGNIKVFLE